LQQLREAIPSDHSYRFLIHDRDSIFSAEVDQQLKAFGLRVLHTPARAPKANAYCERLVGSVRRECGAASSLSWLTTNKLTPCVLTPLCRRLVLDSSLTAQRASFGWFAAIQRSTNSKKSFASVTISSASVWVATEA